jgi:uncharacterized protein with HEPN domain
MWRDEALLIDMLLAATDAREFATGLDLEAFKRSRLHQNAIVRSLEIVGEAASQVSDEFRAQHLDLPWKQMIGMRNRLIHGYSKVSLEVVWEVVEKELPGLIAKIRPLVPPSQEGGA